MNRFFTLLLAASSLTAVGQCEEDFDFGSSTFGSQPAFGGAFLSGYLGSDYFDVWHILIPTSAANISSEYPPTPIDSIQLISLTFTDTLTGEVFLPDQIGMSFSVNSGDSGSPNTFLGDDQYCKWFFAVALRA